jgi:hypothetical protein
MKNLLFLFAFIPFFLCAEVEKEDEKQHAKSEQTTQENQHARSKIKAMHFEEEVASLDDEEDFSFEDDEEQE